MGKIKIGIPRGLYYYYFKDLWITFFDNLGIDYIISPKTNKEILELGKSISSDEMCISLKIYLGHIAYLKDKCDYILIPRIDNYGINNQTCTNFLATYDIVKNIFKTKILNYNIDILNKKLEENAFKNMSYILNKSKNECLVSYYLAKNKSLDIENKKIIENINLLKSSKLKIMIVSHSYNCYDEYIGVPIINILKKYDIEIIFADKFNHTITNKLSKEISKTSYFKYSKEILGSIPYVKNKIDGIIFITSFPCAIDSIATTLAIKKIKIPNIQLIIDEENSLVGFETRIESFIDILERNRLYEQNIIP